MRWHWCIFGLHRWSGWTFPAAVGDTVTRRCLVCTKVVHTTAGRDWFCRESNKEHLRHATLIRMCLKDWPESPGSRRDVARASVDRFVIAPETTDEGPESADALRRFVQENPPPSMAWLAAESMGAVPSREGPQ